MEKKYEVEQINIEILKIKFLDEGLLEHDEDGHPYYEKECTNVRIKFEDRTIMVDQTTADMLTRIVELIKNEKRD